MAAPEDGTPAGAHSALAELVATLRADDTLLASHLRDPDSEPALGVLAASGRRARGAELDYAFVVEAIREGYLLHYGDPRVISGADRDLALLAGDHLYAVGLECLAGLGDLEAVRELADLISLSAQLHAGPEPGRERALGRALARRRDRRRRGHHARARGRQGGASRRRRDREQRQPPSWPPRARRRAPAGSRLSWSEPQTQ